MMSIILIISVFYMLWLFLLANSAWPGEGDNSERPFITVIVAFRNEELVLPACIESLKKLNYPADNIEILLLNDGSEDRGPGIAADMIHHDPRFRLIEVDRQIGDLKAKMNALAIGIECSKGELIAVTDADCRVEADWLLEKLMYVKADTGLIASLTEISLSNDKPKQTIDLINQSKPINQVKQINPVFFHLQAADMQILQSIAGRSAHFGYPITILGNNFLFRRSAYDAVGGFIGLGFSVTEDFALMDAIHRKSDYNIIYHFPSQGARTFTLPERDMPSLIQQRLRWISGGMRAPAVTWSLTALLALARMLFPISLLASILTPAHAVPALFILFSDLNFNQSAAASSRLRSIPLMDMIKWEFYASYYSFRLLLELLRLQPISWKERDLPFSK